MTIPMAQAVMRSLAVNAAKGQHRAQRLFSELLASVESSGNILHAEYLDKALTYKIEWEKELRRRAEAGIEPMDEPIPNPDPDHIKIDFRTGEVRIVGPMTKEEKRELDHWRKKLPDLRSHIDDLREALVGETDPDEIAELERHIQTGGELYEQISTALAVACFGVIKSPQSLRMPSRSAKRSSGKNTQMTAASSIYRLLLLTVLADLCRKLT